MAKVESKALDEYIRKIDSLIRHINYHGEIDVKVSGDDLIDISIYLKQLRYLREKKS